MHICQVISAKIPVAKYGGTERIVQWLCAEFVSAGHKVTLISLPGSDLPGVNCISATTENQAWQAIPPDAEIVHFHSWQPFDDFDKPWLYTLHGNSTTPKTLPTQTVCISADHARRHAKKTFIYNGVNPDELIYNETKLDHLLFFSKVRRSVKGANRALKLAKNHQQRIVMAGGNRFDLLKVGGLIDSFRPGVSFKGEIGGIKKAIQFSQAKALLFPIQWEEPFGLVVIEALLSGTPVIATRRGSMPELINDRVGYIFDEDEEFPEALSHATSCKSSDCRDWAMNYFSSSVCSQNYLALYERVILNKVNWNDADL